MRQLMLLTTFEKMEKIEDDQLAEHIFILWSGSGLQNLFLPLQKLESLIKIALNFPWNRWIIFFVPTIGNRL